jgi:SNF2 family DNA or RNA helicase
VDGSCTQKQRATAIDKFRNDKHCRVFLGQLNACGTAITLTEANQVVFIEQDWTPANNLQAAKRAHRIGQDRPVYVNNLMLHNSIDERISAALTAKTLHLMEIGLCAA